MLTVVVLPWHLLGKCGQRNPELLTHLDDLCIDYNEYHHVFIVHILNFNMFKSCFDIVCIDCQYPGYVRGRQRKLPEFAVAINARQLNCEAGKWFMLELGPRKIHKECIITL